MRLIKVSDSFGKIKPVHTTLTFHYAKIRKPERKSKSLVLMVTKILGSAYNSCLGLFPLLSFKTMSFCHLGLGHTDPTQFSDPCLLLIGRVNRDFISQSEVYTL